MFGIIAYVFKPAGGLPAAGGKVYDYRRQVRWEMTICKGFANDVVPEIPQIFRLRRAFIRKLSQS